MFLTLLMGLPMALLTLKLPAFRAEPVYIRDRHGNLKRYHG